MTDRQVPLLMVQRWLAWVSGARRLEVVCWMSVHLCHKPDDHDVMLLVLSHSRTLSCFDKATGTCTGRARTGTFLELHV